MNSAGTYEIVPDDGYLLDKVEVEVGNNAAYPIECMETYVNGNVPAYTIDIQTNPSSVWKVKGKSKFLSKNNDALFYIVATQGFFAFGAETPSNPRLYLQNGYSVGSDLIFIPYDGGIIEVQGDSNANWLVNDEEYHLSNYQPLNNNSILILRGHCMFYYLTIYKDDTIIFDARPYCITIMGESINVIYDSISKTIIYVQKPLDAKTLDMESVSDYQAITRSNEEYKAITPIL